MNSPSSRCYLEYEMYAPGNDYSSIQRPIVIVLADSGETTSSAFENDTLKGQPQFYNYLFVYLPNKGGNAYSRLECIGSLLSNITMGYFYGSANNFFVINDTSIKRKEIKEISKLYPGSCNIEQMFKEVVLRSETIQDQDITVLFKEDKTAYITETVQDDDFNTYYDEPDTNFTETPEPYSSKQYYGPPTTFNYSLSGTIRDKLTGEGLAYATILINGTSVGVSANSEGYFVLPSVPSDTSVLAIQYVGYDMRLVYLTPAMPKRNLIIELKSSTIQTVTITASKIGEDITSKEDISVVKLTPKKLEKLPNLGEKDVMRSFQLMPGVSASNESSSGLYVRGGTPDQNLVLYDGFVVYHVDHLYGFFSAFNSNALKDIQLYKGGFDARFGGRLSSVTEITGKEGDRKKYNMGVDLSLLGFNAFAEIPVGDKFSSVIAFRRSYKGPLYNKIFEKFNTSSTSNNQQSFQGPGGRLQQETQSTSFFYDLNAKVTYRANPNNDYSISFFNGTDKLDNSVDFDGAGFGGGGGFGGGLSLNSIDLTRYGNVGTSLKWNRKWTTKLAGATSVSYSNYYSLRNRTQERTSTNSSGEEVTSNNGVIEDNDLRDYSFKSDYDWNISSAFQLQFGAFANHYSIRYSYSQNDTITVLDKQSNSGLVGGYLQTKVRFLKSRILVQPGIRLSYFDITNSTYTEPRLNVTVNLTGKLSLKAATGKYYQFANLVTREDILSGNKSFWLLSDGDGIPVSEAVHYTAALAYENAKYLFSTEVYFKELNNLTEYSLRFNPSPDGLSYQENFLTGQGMARGIEFLAQKKTGKINGWVSYTLGEARNYFETYSDQWFAANQDVRHEFKVVGIYQYKRWNFSATWIYASGRPYTAPSGAYTITLLDGSEQDYFTVTSKNSLRLPNYHRADIAVNYTLLGGKRGGKRRRVLGTLGFSLFNLYNRTNVWYKQYTIEEGQILETNVNYLGITPNISLSLKLH